jgi:hypothetical protein
MRELTAYDSRAAAPFGQAHAGAPEMVGRQEVLDLGGAGQ